MLDNISVTPSTTGTTALVASEACTINSVAGVQVQDVKLGYGPHGTFNQVDAGTGLPVAVQGTVPVSASALPLPAGAATDASVQAITTKLGASPAQEHVTAASPLAVRLSDGTAFYNATGGGGGGGTASSFGSAFPANGTAAGFKDSTGANLVPANLDAAGLLKVNVVAGGAGGGIVTQATGTNLHTVVDSGTISLTGALPAGANALGSVSVSNLPATQAISAAALPLPTGAAADGADGTGIALPTGGAGIRGWLSGIYKALINALTVVPNPGTACVSGVTADITDATSHSLVTAPGAGLRNYLTHICITNAGANATRVDILDGATLIYSGFVDANYGGLVLSFPTPLRQPSTATALNVQCATAGAQVRASACGFAAA